MDENMGTTGYLVFRIGREWYGVDVKSVIEVLQLVTLNQVPGSDIVGMMTLRDEVMSVIDVRLSLGLEEVEYALSTPIIAVRGAGGPYGIIVDEADDVSYIDNAQIAPHDDRFVKHVARRNGAILFLLDIEMLSPVMQLKQLELEPE